MKADEEKLVNPNVLCAVFLNHIKKTCGYDTIPEPLDIASEGGEVMDLASKPKEYAKKYLESRSTYIVVKVLGEESEDASPTYVPLLDNAAEKMKFAITNPSTRQKQKKGKEMVKEMKEETIQPKKNEKSDSKEKEKKAPKSNKAR